ncbi:2-(3-amino-3-carboxypropyl)histidine synthase [Nematocida sp. AWRm77]|nr:2-(3-amino-3-carboxypropyl)histidine synthase [Nematocida sp. AWRm77]
MQQKVIGEEYLPPNYKFELEKTIKQIKRRNSKRIALQFPEGVIHLSTVISDIIRCNTEVESVTILSDVVYGACCIDDISTYLIGCDLLVHYGHSCLFEIPKCLVGVLYIFVEISIDVSHCIAMALKHIDTTSLSVLGTIQYNTAVRKVKKAIAEHMEAKRLSDTAHSETDTLHTSCTVDIPRTMPLSVGEVLGCTSPIVRAENVLFLAEGRFHLESVMIQNPNKNFFRYCPATKTLQVETHAYTEFRAIRKNKQQDALKCSSFLVVFGTLGRQGGSLLLHRVLSSLQGKGMPYTVAYLSELDEEFLENIPAHTAVVEIACPRLAIDWGSAFTPPVLTPFEYFTLENVQNEYPMDYYTKEGPKQPWHMLQ